MRGLFEEEGVTLTFTDEALRAVDIQVNLHYIPIYRMPYYEQMGFNQGYCPQAEKYHSETLSIPMYPGLKESDFELA